MDKDIQWWKKFLPIYDSVSIMWMDQQTIPDAVISSDASLAGIGAVGPTKYFHAKLLQQRRHHKGYGIVQFEMMALVIAIRKWSDLVKGYRFAINCDNMACVEIINRGKSRDPVLQDWLRELTYICAVGKCEVVAKYIETTA